MRVNNKLILSAFLAANFLIAPAAALADGYPDTGPEAQAQIKKAVKKASIKKPVKKKAASKPKKQVIKRAVLTPVRKTSLERGKELMNQHRYEEARPWLQKAVQEQRKSAEAWYLYGLYHERTGRFAEAQYFYTKAVQIDPLFDPLSRIMTYPNDTKTALWDKKRPGRVYEIPTMTRSGTIIPPNSPQASRLPNRPDAQNNPVVPKVPVYTPPEPGATPNDGDAWSPSVYVPPSANNNNQVYMPPRANNLNSGGQVYTPPSANNNFEPDRELELEAEAENTSSVVYNPPLPVIYEQSNSEAAYNPPAPEVKAASSSSNSKKAVKAPVK
ncbi:MAG: tetratricopeptide repeat protein, partial [Synergistaceae bacterium]|nr:tetratricopeptide repeat protein [Synergistaceae bacterium]